MNSAGNDIVAITAIDVARTRQPKFYSRIMTSAENELYSGQLSELIPFEHFVWLVWSVKESAYKFMKRFDPELIFSPSKMAIGQLSFFGEYFEGAVRFGEQILCSKSFLNEDYIFSFVNNDDDFSDIHYDIKKVGSSDPDDQSNAVRELLLHKLNHIFPESNLHIIKNSHGWPVITREGEELPIPVSFT
ncbi:MAG TPA: 4'-phosphopantetheinyl transferase superfamily protein, partial [Mucilaginibacter sp.]|nr:4'-phosphopantetheinyl transferase superfamily protein [Mucilaginibacter sp.]